MRGVLCFFSLLGLLLVPGPLLADKEDDPLMQGIAMQEQGWPDAAEKLFRQYLEQNPGDLYAMNQLGLALLKQGRFESASLWLERVALQDPTDTFSRIWLGTLRLRENQAEKAVGFFLEVLKLDPANADAQYFLGVVATSQGRADEAARHLEQAGRSGGGDPALQCRLARAYVKLDMIDKAQNAYETALRHESEHGPALMGLGWLHYNQGRPQAAMELWQRVLQASGNVSPAEARIRGQAKESLALAANELALSACAGGERDKAAELWEQALRFDPGNKAASHYLKESRNNGFALEGVCRVSPPLNS